MTPSFFIDFDRDALVGAIVQELLAHLRPTLTSILTRENNIMATVADILTQAQGISSDAEANAQEVTEAVARIAELISQPQVDQEAVQAVLDSLSESSAKLNDSTTRLAAADAEPEPPVDPNA